MECPIARAADEIGEGWTLLVLREAFKGATTFGDFQASLPITPTTLTRRLELLTERGFFEKRAYRSTPPRARYELTDKARDFLPILMALGAWGNRWLAPKGALLTTIDPESGAPMDVAVIDRRTRREIRSGAVAIAAGPAATKRLREKLKTPLVLGARRADAPEGGSDE